MSYDAVRVGFIHSPKQWCVQFAHHFARGVEAHGGEVVLLSLDDHIPSDLDAVGILGAGYLSTYQRIKLCQVPVVYLDKGYTRYARRLGYIRVSLDTRSPVQHVAHLNCGGDRRIRLGWQPQAWRSSGEHILFAWSSHSFNLFEGLPPLEDYAHEVISIVHAKSARTLVHRPKPNGPSFDIVGARLSANLEAEDDLVGAHAVVVYGSGICVDALLAGVPSVVLGDAVTRPISSTNLNEIENPRLASNLEVTQLLNNLAYCQWTSDEFASGEAWAFIRGLLTKG